MIVSYRRRLEKLSSQLMPKSNGKLEAAQKLDDYIRKAVPAEWEWILKEEINLSVTAYPNSDPELTILHFKQRMALAVAGSRGWMDHYHFIPGEDWGFLLEKSNENGDWGIMYLMGVTPYRFSQRPEKQRAAMLVQARTGIASVCAELSQQGFSEQTNRKKYYQAYKRLNLARLLQ